MNGRKEPIYGLFIGVVLLILTLTKSTPDLVTLNFVSLASSYGGLLTALGGFSITVLAVLLGLEALDAGREEPFARVAHAAAVRHVSVSLAVACITCFVGANLMGEAAAQTVAIDDHKAAAVTRISLQLEAAGMPRSKIAEAQAVMRTPEGPEAFFTSASKAQVVLKLLDASKAGKSPAAAQVRDSARHLDSILDASGRRLFLVASVSAYLASLVILQSLAFLLRIRFPRTASFTALQNFAVLTIGGLLFIKLAHTASYGLEGVPFFISRIAIGVGLLAIVGIYRLGIGAQLRDLRSSTDRVEGYTPLGPYYAVLGTCVASAFLLAATFAAYGPPTILDRVVVIGGAVLCTAMLLVIQLEQPTIELLGGNVAKSDPP